MDTLWKAVSCQGTKGSCKLRYEEEGSLPSIHEKLIFCKEHLWIKPIYLDQPGPYGTSHYQCDYQEEDIHRGNPANVHAPGYRGSPCRELSQQHWGVYPSSMESFHFTPRGTWNIFVWLGGPINKTGSCQSYGGELRYFMEGCPVRCSVVYRFGWITGQSVSTFVGTHAAGICGWC